MTSARNFHKALCSISITIKPPQYLTLYGKNTMARSLFIEERCMGVGIACQNTQKIVYMYNSAKEYSIKNTSEVHL